MKKQISVLLLLLMVTATVFANGDLSISETNHGSLKSPASISGTNSHGLDRTPTVLRVLSI